MSARSHVLLRIGVSFTFIYAGISGFLSPDNWIGFFPPILRFAPDSTLIALWGIAEVLLGVWLLSRWKIRISASLAAAALFGIVVFNLGALDIVFRDIGLFFASLTLLFGGKERKSTPLPKGLTRISPQEVGILKEYEEEEEQEEEILV